MDLEETYRDMLTTNSGFAAEILQFWSASYIFEPYFAVRS
jgi:hypothetical protein